MTDLRQACDRCHGKKLRCTKTPGSLICTRCIKASVPCIYSPPTRSLRHGAAAQETCGPSLPFDWSAIDMSFNNLPQNDPFSTTTPTPPVSDSTEQTSGSSVFSESAQLTELIAALNSIYLEFPLPDLSHMPLSQVRQFSEDMAVKSDLQSKLEHLLRRTQQLSMVYPLIIKTIAERIKAASANPDSVCDVPDCLHRKRHSLQGRQQPLFDHSIINLLIASHLRLLDILDNLGNHSRVCAFIVESMPEDHEPQFDIPVIRIGSFVASKGSAASMLVSMMIELNASLSDRCHELIDMICSVRDKAPREVQLLQLQCEALEVRAKATLADLRTIRDQLRKAGLML